MLLSHISQFKPFSLSSLSSFPISSIPFFSSSSLSFTAFRGPSSSSKPLFRFYPFHSLKSRPCHLPLPPPPSSSAFSFACHVSTRGFPMDSPPPPDLAESAVDSVARDLKNQSLDDDKVEEAGPTLLNSDDKKKKKSLEDLCWDHSFVTALPGDRRTDTIPREVNSSSIYFLQVSCVRLCSVAEKRKEKEKKIMKVFCIMLF